MNQTYAFDSFADNLKKAELERLTQNVGSHAKVLCEHFLSNGLLAAKRVLDVGCGTGAMVDMFASMLPDISFTGVDNSKEMIQNTANFQNPNVAFLEGEATELPFEDNSFDFVYTRLVLMHNPDPSRIIQEMTRVSKPGGVIASVEIDDGSMIFHPYGEQLSLLIAAHVQYARSNGMDRTMGRKLYSLYKEQHVKDVKVIIQTSDYTGPFEEMPFSFRLALGDDKGRHLVQGGFLSEAERLECLDKLNRYCQDPSRYSSGSFMYCFGRKA